MRKSSEAMSPANHFGISSRNSSILLGVVTGAHRCWLLALLQISITFQSEEDARQANVFFLIKRLPDLANFVELGRREFE